MPIMDQGVRMFRCAAFTRGCLSTLTVPNMSQKDVDLLLNLNGWQKDHGRWVCGQHEQKPTGMEHNHLIQGD